MFRKFSTSTSATGMSVAPPMKRPSQAIFSPIPPMKLKGHGLPGFQDFEHGVPSLDWTVQLSKTQVLSVKNLIAPQVQEVYGILKIQFYSNGLITTVAIHITAYPLQI